MSVENVNVICAENRKDRFLQHLQLLDKKQNKFNVITSDEYKSLLSEVEKAISAVSKTSAQYRRLKRFRILEISGKKKLVTLNEPFKYYLPMDEIFDVIESAHLSIGHGGRDRMKIETSRKYANITSEMIQIFLSMCETCQQKKNKKRKGLVSKPIIHSEMNSRCQVDLIDMQSQADNEFRFIMVYQDHLTKFVLLRALKSKRAEEVALELLDIFLTFGAPCILQSDNGKEFVNSVIEELAKYWPELKIVHGKPRHSQSQGSIERANQDLENMLASWMKDNKTTNWSYGLRFVQFMKNRALHSGIKQSPYKAMFGIEPRVGLTTSTLPSDIIKNMKDEDELQKIFEDMNAEEQETEQAQLGEYMLASKSTNISLSRKEAGENLIKQAKRMKMISDAIHPEVDIGGNVVVPIPNVDRGNLISVVLDKNEDGLYKIVTKDGVLNKLYWSEENVWKLCEYVKIYQPEIQQFCFAVFISNKNESVPLWCQKSGKQADNLAVWDYHVIFIYQPQNDKGTMVYDLNTTLPYPVELEKYAPCTFGFDSVLDPCYHRFFRVVPCEIFLKTFASDRSRMKKPDGTWMSPPPDYPCIRTTESINNLEDFISMDPKRGVGEVLSLQQFLGRFL